eukprot:141846-Chlamydomonas_euryale.AAC.1
MAWKSTRRLTPWSRSALRRWHAGHGVDDGDGTEEGGEQQRQMQHERGYRLHAGKDAGSDELARTRLVGKGKIGWGGGGARLRQGVARRRRGAGKAKEGEWKARNIAAQAQHGEARRGGRGMSA